MAIGVIEDDGAGLLVPLKPALPAKLICKRTAELLEQLRTASTLCEDWLSQDDRALLLARLVLDSVVEVEDESGFCSGPRASFLFASDQSDRTTGACSEPLDSLSRASRVSEDALRYAERLELEDPLALSMRLYCYNRIPITPRWSLALRSDDAVTRWLGLESGSSLVRQLAVRWIDTPPPTHNRRWRIYRCRVNRPAARFKLYVNVRPEHLREALSESIPIFERYDFRSFKLGLDAGAVLRPDKFVAYAESQDQIVSAADALALRLRGMTPQVVPFTASIDQEGLVSWGVDPPRTAWWSTIQGTSWRRWIADRLALALIAASAAGLSSPSRFALQRLSMEGVDVNRWTPRSLSWDSGPPT
jgi:hypothetical protein